MTGEDLVAAELAHLDQVAADLTVRDDEAEYACQRAYGLRRLPVETAAHILRQEAFDALGGKARPPIYRVEPVWWLGVVAKRAGFSIWEYTTDTGGGLLRGDVLRLVRQQFKRQRAAAKTRARRAADRDR